MKNNPILRYILIELMYVIFYLIGIFIYFEIVYPFRKFWRKYKHFWICKFFWLFLNDTTKKDENDIDYGDYGRYSHTIFGAYRQSAIRNSHWNLKLLLKPNNWNPINISPKGNSVTMLNFDTYGYRKTFFNLGNKRYFIRTLTKDILFGSRIFNYQFGVNKDRYIFKIRSVSKKKYNYNKNVRLKY